jgi:hypothetical protein
MDDFIPVVEIHSVPPFSHSKRESPASFIHKREKLRTDVEILLPFSSVTTTRNPRDRGVTPGAICSVFSSFEELRNHLTMEIFTRALLLLLVSLIGAMGFHPSATSIYRNTLRCAGRKVGFFREGPAILWRLHKKNPFIWETASSETSKQRTAVQVASTTELKCSLHELDRKAAEWKLFMGEQFDRLLNWLCAECLDDEFDNYRVEDSRADLKTIVLDCLADLKTRVTKTLRAVRKILMLEGAYNTFFEALESARHRIYDALESAFWYAFWFLVYIYFLAILLLSPLKEWIPMQ